MPIALTCTCGRSMRVKDEAAGKKIRCPTCSSILTVPQPETSKAAEEEAINFLLEEENEPAPDDSHEIVDNAPATDAIQPPRPGPPPPPPEPPPPQWKWRKKKPPPEPIRKRKPGFVGKVFNNVNPNYGVLWTGIAMMLGAGGLGLVNGVILLLGYIWPYFIAITVVLFFVGLGTFFKGLMGRSN